MAMPTPQLLAFVVNIHTTTVVAFIDAAMRADTVAARNDCLNKAREAVLDFKQESLPMMLDALKGVQ